MNTTCLVNRHEIKDLARLRDMASDQDVDCGVMQPNLHLLSHVCTCTDYGGELKGLYVLLSRTQSEQLSNSKKKILATTYKPFRESLYMELEFSHLLGCTFLRISRIANIESTRRVLPKSGRQMAPTFHTFLPPRLGHCLPSKTALIL